jgi:hypothetical protein
MVIRGFPHPIEEGADSKQINFTKDSYLGKGY